jgi:hypothetical protein
MVSGEGGDLMKCSRPEKGVRGPTKGHEPERQTTALVGSRRASRAGARLCPALGGAELRAAKADRYSADVHPQLSSTRRKKAPNRSHDMRSRNDDAGQERSPGLLRRRGCLIAGAGLAAALLIPGASSTAQVTNDAADRRMTITIGSKTFQATLEDNPTVAKLKALLPLTLSMTELNGNEKYHHFSTRFPTDGISPGTIQSGDLMLYGNNSLVLFYKTFETSYSYTRLGRIDDPSGLADAVGRGNVSVTLELE